MRRGECRQRGRIRSFAATGANGEVAPKGAVRQAEIEPPRSDPITDIRRVVSQFKMWGSQRPSRPPMLHVKGTGYLKGTGYRP
jgi:hypothetical protein